MNITFAFLSHWHIIVVVLVIVLLFGGKRIPQLMKGLGEGMKEFKNATKQNNDSDEKEIEGTKDKIKE